LATDIAGKHPHAVVAPDAWRAAAEFLRDDPELKFDYLRAVSGVDYPKESKLVSVYDLISTAYRHTFAVKVETPRENPHIPSVAGVWPTAEWHEREAYDLLGIVYDGHPNLTRILLPEDWQGHPLRKDYVFPKEYNGIPCASTVNP
jgi:NADH-quinone oxidoreductase subunit C